MAERVESKIIDLDIRGAVKIISSTDIVAKANDQTFTELKRKHPEPSRPLNFPDDQDDSIRPLIANSPSVLRSINSFPTGSSAGIDGLTSQQIKDLFSISGDNGRKLLTSPTKL